MSPCTRTNGEAEGSLPHSPGPGTPPQEEALLRRNPPLAAGGKLPETPPPPAAVPADPGTARDHRNPRASAPDAHFPPLRPAPGERRAITVSAHCSRSPAGSSSRPPRRRTPPQALPPHFLPLGPPGRLLPRPCERGRPCPPSQSGPRWPEACATCGAVATPCGWRRIAPV